MLGVEWQTGLMCPRFPQLWHVAYIAMPSAFVRISDTEFMVAMGHVSAERCDVKGRTTVGTKSKRYVVDERTTGRDESVSMNDRQREHSAAPALRTI